MDGWKDGRMDGWTDGRTDGQTDGWTDGWTETVGKTKSLIHDLWKCQAASLIFSGGWMEGRMDGQTDGRMDRQTDFPPILQDFFPYQGRRPASHSCKLPNT